MLASNSTRQALLHPLSIGRARAVGLATAVVLWALSQTGCTVFQHARRTCIQEPSQYSWRWDRGRSLKVYRQWADQAWAAESGDCPEVGSASEYSLGFRDGFVDFVYAGGDGQPPPVPPRKFWNVAWRNPQGDFAAQQWFAGYRHGAQVARNGGYRQSGIVNASFKSEPGLAPGLWTSDAPVESSETVEPLGAPIETLPVPPGIPANDRETAPVTPVQPSRIPAPGSLEDMLPADDTGVPQTPAEAIPGGAAPATPTPGIDVLPTEPPSTPDAPSLFDTPAGEVNPAAAVVPAKSGAQRFRRALSTVRITPTSAAK